VLPGVGCNALTNGGIVLAIGHWAGHWFANTERHAGPRVLFARLAGATAMLAAIGFVLL